METNLEYVYKIKKSKDTSLSLTGRGTELFICGTQSDTEDQRWDISDDWFLKKKIEN
jgi:hypothetical protein